MDSFFLLIYSCTYLNWSYLNEDLLKQNIPLTRTHSMSHSLIVSAKNFIYELWKTFSHTHSHSHSHSHSHKIIILNGWRELCSSHLFTANVIRLLLFSFFFFSTERPLHTICQIHLHTLIINLAISKYKLYVRIDYF